jgi:DNA repair protein RadA/Sms
VLEHVVDVVLHFEGDRNSRFRMLRALKNRFGPVDEVGCFDLAAEGITAVTDPTGLFVENHEHRVPGTCVAVTMEGRRPMLAEVQALVTRSALERPRRTTSGLDGSRVAMILAVLQQHCRVSLLGSDVFVSTVGGARLTEPATDLAIAVALASAGTGAAPPRGVVALGEISLAGEVRKVRDLPQRIAEAARLGFRVAVVPTAAGRKGVPGRSHTVDGMTVLETPDLVGALRLLGMTDTRQPRGPAVEAVAPPREEEPREPLRSRPDDAAEPGEAPPLDPSTLEGWTMPEPLEPHDDPDEWPPLRSV